MNYPQKETTSLMQKNTEDHSKIECRFVVGKFYLIRHLGSLNSLRAVRFQAGLTVAGKCGQTKIKNVQVVEGVGLVVFTFKSLLN